MKNEIEMLNKYYDSFINIADEADFYIGMCDYLRYTDKVPAIETISAELPKQRSKIEHRLKTIEKKAINELIVKKEEIKKIIDLKKIDDLEINEELKSFQDWIEGKITGSLPVPFNLSPILVRIIHKLISLGYRENIDKYLEYPSNNPNYIQKYNLSLNLEKFQKEKNVYDAGLENELWGEFNTLSTAYFVITNGQNYFDELVKADPKDVKKFWEAMNFSALLGEWKEVRDHKKRKYEVFFKKNQIEKAVKRFHNFLLENLLLSNNKNQIKDQVPKQSELPAPTSLSAPIIPEEVIVIGPLVYKNKRIYYDENKLDFKPQEVKVCKAIMKYALTEDCFIQDNDLIFAATVYDEVSRLNMQKIVSKIRRVLREENNKIDIESEYNSGYFVNFKDIRQKFDKK